LTPTDNGLNTLYDIVVVSLSGSGISWGGAGAYVHIKINFYVVNHYFKDNDYTSDLMILKIDYLFIDLREDSSIKKIKKPPEQIGYGTYSLYPKLSK